MYLRGLTDSDTFLLREHPLFSLWARFAFDIAIDLDTGMIKDVANSTTAPPPTAGPLVH